MWRPTAHCCVQPEDSILQRADRGQTAHTAPPSRVSHDGSAPASNRVVPAKPGAARRHPFGLTILTLFLVVQSIDGAFTYFAVVRFGPGAEGNPLVATLIHALGQGPGLVSVKLFAAMLGALLYVTSGYRILAALVFFYLAVAILPWAATF